MTQLHWTEVDGVAVVWVEASGPMRAGLLFRAGRADETLVTAGITHLLEHMALDTLSGPAHRHNGFVGGVVTGFTAVGLPAEVSDVISGVCRGISSLSEDGLESGRQVIAAESAARSYDPVANLLSWRYGAAGYGLMGMREVGSRNVTMAQLRDLALQRFTRGNAVLWMTGPPPSGMKLALPEGTRQPIASPVAVPRACPRWFVDDMCGGVAVAVTVPRTAASSILCDIASIRLSEALRTERAISYAPGVIYDPLDADTAHLILLADSDRDRREELADAFGEVLEGLERIEEAEVAAARTRLAERYTGSLAPSPDDMAALDVSRAAMDWIFGRAFETIEALVAEYSTVTASDVSAIADGMKDSALFALPGAALIRPWMGEKAGPSTGLAVQGRQVMSVDAPVQRERLVYGSQGVSVVQPDGSHSTVLYSDLAAGLRHEDGGICLVGSDATAITVEPTLWRDGPSVCREITERVPGHMIAEQAARAASDIPKPVTTRWQRLRAGSGTILGWSLLALSAIAAVGILAFIVPEALAMVYFDGGSIGVAGPAFLVLMPLVLVGGLLYIGIRVLADAKAR